jgi:23S rRNA pseudouridine1911/1915/1917 synthase
MHTAPLRSGETGTLLDWIAPHFPETLRIAGRKAVEGGLVHRLDYETQGLVLCARSAEALELFLAMQNAGGIVKEYEAVCCKAYPPALPSFSPLPEQYAPPRDTALFLETSLVIESAFRPFGKGRKAVRPLVGENAACTTEKLYRTEILSAAETDDKTFFRIAISKGFRHQIRCHLAWIGYPILNDPVYAVVPSGDTLPDHFGETETKGILALRACSIGFKDPDRESDEPILIQLT